MSDIPASFHAATDAATRPNLPRVVKPGDAAKLKQTAEEYEAVFISQMLQPMFDGIKTDPRFGGGQAEGIYRSMMVSEYGKAMAKRGGIGLADALTQSLLRTQEVR
ncbi:MAG TPA: rod-binding protein [Alphaproteobacteria bacterium]|jgi:Rod binding domain-containing protein